MGGSEIMKTAKTDTPDSLSRRRVTVSIGVLAGVLSWLSLFLPLSSTLLVPIVTVGLIGCGVASVRGVYDGADWPLLLLMGGTFVFGRAFSLIALPAGAIPLYIIEPLLAVAILLLLFRRGWPWRWWNSFLPQSLEMLLAVYFLLGVLYMGIGVAGAGLPALRDAPFNLYAVALVPTLALFADRRRLESLPLLLLPAAVAVLLLGFTRFFVYIPWPCAFRDLSLDMKMIGMSLTFGLILVFSLCFFSLVPRWSRRLLFFVAYLALLFVVMAEMRAAWIGLLAALLLVAVLLWREMRVVPLLLALVFVSILVINYFGLGVQKNKLDSLKTEVTSMVAPSPENMSGANIVWRLNIWRQTWAEIREFPVFGWGYGIQIDYVTQKARPADEWKYRLSWLRANDVSTGILPPHNHLLAVTYKTGGVGLALFLCIQGFVFFWGLYYWPRCRHDVNRRLLGAALAGLLLWHGMAFFFDMLESPATSIYLWLLLGLVLAVVRDETVSQGASGA
jgi:O-antigen ligase